MSIEINSATPLTVTQEELPDNTLVMRGREECTTDHLHICLVVRTVEPVGTVEITTRVTPK